MELRNKYRFWTGIGIFGIQFLGASVWGLSKLKWNWINSEVLKYSVLGLVFIAINLIAFWLVKDGSEKPAVKGRSCFKRAAREDRK